MVLAIPAEYVTNDLHAFAELQALNIHKLSTYIDFAKSKKILERVRAK